MGRLAGGGEEGRQRGVPGAAFSSDQGAVGGEDRPGQAFGRQARPSGADPGDEEAVGRRGGGDEEGRQQGVLRAAFSSDQGADGGEDRPGRAFGRGAAAGANAPAEGVSFASAVPVSAPEVSAAPADALFAAAPVEAGPDGLPADASNTDRVGALVGSDLAATGALPGANLPTDTLYQAALLRATSLNAELTLSGATDDSDFSKFLEGDGAFLELWDRDQLLFPDSLPKAEEMPFPDEAPDLSGSLSRGEPPVEVPIPAGAVGEAPARPDGQEAVAAPAPAAELALSSPDANGSEVSLGIPTGVPAAQGEDPLRPYKIALGLLPFLPAFGFTAVTLREEVQAARRLWQALRRRRPHDG